MSSLLKKLYIPKWLSHKLISLVTHYMSVGWSLFLSSQAFGSTRDFVWLSLRTALISPPIKWQWHTTTIVILLLLLGLETLRYLLSKFLKRFQRNYFFNNQPYSTLTWKANKENGDIEKIPYCRIHKTMLILIGEHYRCSDCGSLRVGHTSIRQANFEYQIVSSKAKAIVEGHYRRTPILPIRIFEIIHFYIKIIMMSFRKNKKAEIIKS